MNQWVLQHSYFNIPCCIQQFPPLSPSSPHLRSTMQSETPCPSPYSVQLAQGLCGRKPDCWMEWCFAFMLYPNTTIRLFIEYPTSIYNILLFKFYIKPFHGIASFFICPSNLIASLCLAACLSCIYPSSLCPFCPCRVHFVTTTMGFHKKIKNNTL